MSVRYWLSIDEIAQLWSAETGEQVDALRRDLEDWFDEYLKRPKEPGAQESVEDDDNTNLLMGLLGSRHLQKKTFETYLKERGRPTPAFWFSGQATGDVLRPIAPPAQPPAREARETWETRETREARQPAEAPAAFRRISRNRPETQARAPSKDTLDLAQQLAAAQQRIVRLDADLEAAGRDREEQDERLLATRRELDALRRLARNRSAAPAQRAASDRGGARFVLTIVAGLLAVSAGLILWPAKTDRDPARTLANVAPAVPVVPVAMGADAEDEAPAAPAQGLGSYRGSEISEPPAQAADEAAAQKAAEAAAQRAAAAQKEAAIQREAAAQRADELRAARKQIANLSAALETSSAEAAELSQQLAAAKEDFAKLRRATVEKLEAEREDSAQAAEAAASKVADLERALKTAKREAAVLSTAASKSSDEAERLGERLAAAEQESAQSRRELEELRTALAASGEDSQDLRDRLAAAQHALAMTRLKAAEQADAQEDELSRAVTVAAAETAALKRELEAERRKIAGLGTAVQTSTAQSGRLNAQLASVLRELDAAREKLGLSPKTVEKQTIVDEQASFSEAAALQSDVIAGRLQTASLEQAKEPRTVRLGTDTIYLDDLVLGPDSYLGQEVVVTGSLARFFRRYRLQSRTAGDSIAVDVEGLRPEDLMLLEETIDKAGLLGTIRARVKGTVERQSPTSYRLVASDLRLFE